MTARRASAAEQEIRDALVAFLRSVSSGRIIHELNVCGTGSKRVDVALIEPEFIAMFEIKSERDTLKRLDDQSDAFSRASHFYRPVLHEKHYVEVKHECWTKTVLAKPSTQVKERYTWQYPEPEDRYGSRKWDIGRIAGFGSRRVPQPRAAVLLDMLWRAELITACHRHGLTTGSRIDMATMIEEMTWQLSGKEVCRLVCAALRGRDFVEADPPIYEKEAA